MAKPTQPPTSGGNKAPTSVSLSAATVRENQTGVQIGVLSATDPNKGDKVTFTVVDPSSPFVAVQENGIWVLKLKAGVSLDFESASTLTVQVKATDSGGLSLTQAFTITVTNVNEAPTGITLATEGVDENAVGGTVIGLLSGVDPDAGDTLTFSLDGASGDNALVEIVGTEIRVREGVSINFETNPVLNLSVVVTDGQGLTYTRPLSIDVRDLPEGPTVITGSDSILNGTEGDDHITGTSTEYSQILKGYGGNDTLILPGNFGGVAHGNEGNDTIFGASADAWFVQNELRGDEGDDTITGGSASGSSSVNNFMYAGTGSDNLTGGDASGQGQVWNVFVMGDLDSGDRLVGGTGAENTLEAFGTEAVESIQITETGWLLNDQTLDISGIQGFMYAAGGGADRIDASQSGLTYLEVLGQGGDDVLIGSTNFVTPPDPPYGDKNPYYGLISNRLAGGLGLDTITGGDARGGNVTNDLYGDEENDTLTAGSATAGNVRNWIGGDQGDDLLVGGTAAGGQVHDTLVGGDGDDTLVSGKGTEYTGFLLGGVGSDEFVFGIGGGTVEVSDFERGWDVIDVTAYELGGFDQLAIDTTTGSSVITLDDGRMITVYGVTGLGAQDFVF